MSGPAANTRNNPEPSREAKENAAALKEVDPQTKEDWKAAGAEAGGADDGSKDYKPSKDTAEGKDLDEGVELEEVDDEVV